MQRYCMTKAVTFCSGARAKRGAILSCDRRRHSKPDGRRGAVFLIARKLTLPTPWAAGLPWTILYTQYSIIDGRRWLSAAVQPVCNARNVREAFSFRSYSRFGHFERLNRVPDGLGFGITASKWTSTKARGTTGQEVAEFPFPVEATTAVEEQPTSPRPLL